VVVLIWERVGDWDPGVLAMLWPFSSKKCDLSIICRLRACSFEMLNRRVCGRR
jgi:hypothetical protein